jgi:uncharacterized protein
MRVKEKFDGWVSSVLAFGTSRDKLGSLGYVRPARLPFDTLDSLYTNNALASKIIDLLADDCTREGIDIEQDGEDVLCDAMEALSAWKRINQGIKYARIFGGSAVYIDVDDGLDPWEPVNLDACKMVRKLTPIEGNYIIPWPTYMPYTEPTMYSATGFELTTRIHASRLMLFYGIMPTERERQRNNGWGVSILQRLYEALRNYGLVTNAAATIMTDFTRSVYKLAGLNELLLTGNDEDIVKKLTAMEDGSSMLNANVLDSEDSYEKKTTNVAGLDKMMTSAEHRLCAESDYPHTMLFGEAPGASLGESGQGQKRDYYDRVKYWQENNLRPELNKLVNILAACSGVPYPVYYEFESLWQENKSEEANTEYTQAQTDQIYISTGVLTPEEVRQERFADDDLAAAPGAPIVPKFDGVTFRFPLDFDPYA